jgi:hypothetical protein
MEEIPTPIVAWSVERGLGSGMEMSNGRLLWRSVQGKALEAVSQRNESGLRLQKI